MSAASWGGGKRTCPFRQVRRADSASAPKFEAPCGTLATGFDVDRSIVHRDFCYFLINILLVRSPHLNLEEGPGERIEKHPSLRGQCKNDGLSDRFFESHPLGEVSNSTLELYYLLGLFVQCMQSV